jgi:hypothetical protein
MSFPIPQPKYHVVVAPVREVSLVASADAEYWSRRTLEDGRARLVVTGAEAKFLGKTFRELSISVFVSFQPGGAKRDGAYLLQAWNSVRFFAFVERTLFHTPYAGAEVLVDTVPPESVGVFRDKLPLFSAMMGRSEVLAHRTPSRNGPEGWEGPIFLPDSNSGNSVSNRLFFARLEGETAAYPFLTDVDALTIQPTEAVPVLAELVDSHFAGHEWLVRSAGTHAKSKTIRRPATAAPAKLAVVPA